MKKNLALNSDGDDSAVRTRQIAKRLRGFIKTRSRFDEGLSIVETLVATILSQNTSDINSHRAYLQLRATYPRWSDVVQADQTELADVIRSGGLADQKSRTIINALQHLQESYGSLDLEHFAKADDEEILSQLTAIRGVGIKTAACVLMFSLGRDICAVDTHVHRVANRLGIVATPNPDATFHTLRPLIPKGKAREFHVDLIRFGRRICKAQRPHCFECPLYDLCPWEEKENYAEAQQQGPRPASADLLLLDVIKDGQTGAGKKSRSKVHLKQQIALSDS